MRKWLWIFLILIVIFFFVGYLYNQGYIHTDWQWLTVILAAAAGPVEFIRKMITGETVTAKKLAQRQNLRNTSVERHKEIYEKIIKQKEQRIRELEAQVAKLEDKVDRLQLELQSIDKEVENMNTEQLQDEFIKYYGE